MEYNDNADISGASVNRPAGASGGVSGGRIAVGGGAGIIVLILALLFGFDPSSLLGTGTGSGDTAAVNPVTACTRGSDVAKNRECRWNAYMASIGGYWSGAPGFPGFQATSMTIFTNQVSTGCGAASSQVGPFYCPADQVIYVDTAFTAQLLEQLGAKGGDAAEAYIVAHEYGHHLQNLLGTMAKAQSSTQTGAGSAAVRLELQADCFAGVWFRHSTDNPNGAIKSVTQDDLNRIVDAAMAVGDDAIQKMQTGQVNPEGWTHGSSAQRKKWVATGFKYGDWKQCDTFTAANLG